MDTVEMERKVVNSNMYCDTIAPYFFKFLIKQVVYGLTH